MKNKTLSPVGYRRPPKHSQFKKGQSGNKRGRPAGSKNLATVFHQELSRRLSVTENGKRRTISKLEAVVKQVVNMAVQGDAKALQALMNISRELGDFKLPDVQRKPTYFTFHFFEPLKPDALPTTPRLIEHQSDDENDV